MPFEIEVTREAESDFDKIRPFYRRQILDAVESHLQHTPTRTSRSRIKRLRSGQKTLKIETLDDESQRKILKAKRKPLVLTAPGSPVLVVRNVLDDDVADDLIAENPEFRRTIELARKKKAQGLVKSLTELRRKYIPIRKKNRD